MSLEQLENWIENSDNIVFFGGAGVSTESGIPDFRSENGIFKAINEYGYPPERILSRSFFDSHKDVFFDYFKKTLLFRDAVPNPAHIALAKLEQKGKLKAVVTQNIDHLHQMAGSKNVLELHGSVYRNFCIGCGKKFDLSYVLEKKGIPQCSQCGGVIRPDIVLYEEYLNESVLAQSIEAVSKAEMLIVGGTSLNVYPAAGMIDYYQGKKLVLINQSPTSFDQKANLVIRERIGEVFQKILRNLEKK